MYPTLKKRAAQVRVWRRAETGPCPSERQALEDLARRGGLLVMYRAGKRQLGAADGTPLSPILFTLTD
jgi:hypothetical protein